MLRPISILLIVVATFSIAKSEETTYKDVNSQKNLILNLKLKIYELREKNSKLEEIISNFNAETKEENRRAKAIAQLKKDLRMSRRTRAEPLLLVR